jgi:hypothetical protein
MPLLEVTRTEGSEKAHGGVRAARVTQIDR